MAWFEISLETEGLERLHTLMRVLKKFHSAIGGVKLHGIKRSEYSGIDIETGIYASYKGMTSGDKSESDYENVDNSTILRGLAAQGRDFVTQSDRDIAEMEHAFVVEVERRAGALLASLPAKDAGKALKTALKASSIDDKEASAIAGASFIAAMKRWMDQVASRIDRQDTNVPPFNGELTPRYAEEKRRRTGGWIKPIGKLTGQLLENLNASGPAAGKITLIRGKSSS